MSKRTFDFIIALLGLLLLTPFFALVGILVKLDSPGPILFRQERVGRGFRFFTIYKFRTMIHDRPVQGDLITPGNDHRVTRVGSFLRKTKIDELPQLINVLKGDMSLVGPRPEVPRYVELFRKDYGEILKVRPGITDPASLKYRDEAKFLAAAENAEEEYLHRVLPEKIALNKQYIREASFLFDLNLIVRTLLRVFELERAK